MTLGSRIPVVVLLAVYAAAGLLIGRPLLAAPHPPPPSIPPAGGTVGGAGLRGVVGNPPPDVHAVSEYPILRPARSPAPRASVLRPPAPAATPSSAPSATASATVVTPTGAPAVAPGPPVHVVRTCPIDGDTDLLPPAPVHIVFDQPMDGDPSTVSVTITPPLPFRVEWLAPEHLLVRTAPREAGVEYTLTLQSARSRLGGSLAEPLTLTFGQGGAGAPIPILMYHHILGLEADADHELRRWTVSPQSLAAQLDLLTSLGAHVVSLGEVVDYLRGGEPLPARPVVLTFDDGYASVYANAVPTLQERGMTATFFITPDYIGSSAFMNWDQIRALGAAGFTIGAHGYEHVRVDALTAAEAERHLGASRRWLEEETGQEVRLFAYPYGYYSARAMRQLAAYGYQAAVVTDPVVRQRPGRLLFLGRIYMEYDELVGTLPSKLPWPPF